MNRPVPTVESLSRAIERSGARPRAGTRTRLCTLLATLGQQADEDMSTVALVRNLEVALEGGEPDRVWLALAVLDARLPDSRAVHRGVRAVRLDGPCAALARALRPGRRVRLLRSSGRTVEVVTGKVLVDVHHTSQTTFATGIQRVARQAVQRWHRNRDPLLVGWTPDYTALRRLGEPEVQRACYGVQAPGQGGQRQGGDVLVPWKCTYILPELLAEPPRAERLKAMVEFSGSSSAVIGFDCVPLTTAETTAYGMSGGFALNLAAVARMDRVATISGGAATEYRGWRSMIGGAGLDGPHITPIPLPVEAGAATPNALREARDLLTAGDQPMVLVVGSHEPRKNHLAVLHAAELLWRDGATFTLNFVGGHSWSGERFQRRVAELQAMHRPVQSISALSDELLWAAYRVARFTVFPSLNEGFGLPVAESLASGTPVITSNFGSMREIAARGGAILVDPRDDHELARAMRSLLTDDDLHHRLTDEARRVTVRSWDEYAEQSWQYLVEGITPVGDPLDFADEHASGKAG